MYRKSRKRIQRSRIQPVQRVHNNRITSISPTRLSSTQITHSAAVRLAVPRVRNSSLDNSPTRRRITRTTNQNTSIRTTRTTQQERTSAKRLIRNTSRLMHTTERMIITLISNSQKHNNRIHNQFNSNSAISRRVTIASRPLYLKTTQRRSRASSRHIGAFRSYAFRVQ